MKIASLNKDLHSLQNQLNSETATQRDLHDKRAALSKEIRDAINQVRKEREARDALTHEVQTLKNERAELNKQLATKREAHAKILEQKKELITKLKVGDPDSIIKEIRRIEYAIETEAPSFEKETKLMKRINQLKKQLTSAKQITEISTQARNLHTELSAIKQKADTIHELIQDKAHASQQKHHATVQLSTKIDDLTTQEKEITKQLAVREKTLGPINQQLEEKLEQFATASEHQRQENVVRTAQRTATIKQQLAQKRLAVEDKLKRGEKLTTDDLRMLQMIVEQEEEHEKGEKK